MIDDAVPRLIVLLKDERWNIQYNSAMILAELSDQRETITILHLCSANVDSSQTAR